MPRGCLSVEPGCSSAFSGALGGGPGEFPVCFEGRLSAASPGCARAAESRLRRAVGCEWDGDAAACTERSSSQRGDGPLGATRGGRVVATGAWW